MSSKFLSLKKIFNQKGMSLAEVMIAGALMVASGVAMMKMQDNQVKTAKSITQKNDKMLASGTLRYYLQRNSDCKATLQKTLDYYDASGTLITGFKNLVNDSNGSPWTGNFTDIDGSPANYVKVEKIMDETTPTGSSTTITKETRYFSNPDSIAGLFKEVEKSKKNGATFGEIHLNKIVLTEYNASDSILKVIVEYDKGTYTTGVRMPNDEIEIAITPKSDNSGVESCTALSASGTEGYWKESTTVSNSIEYTGGVTVPSGNIIQGSNNTFNDGNPSPVLIRGNDNLIGWHTNIVIFGNTNTLNDESNHTFTQGNSNLYEGTSHYAHVIGYENTISSTGEKPAFVLGYKNQLGCLDNCLVSGSLNKVYNGEKLFVFGTENSVSKGAGSNYEFDHHFIFGQDNTLIGFDSSPNNPTGTNKDYSQHNFMFGNNNKIDSVAFSDGRLFSNHNHIFGYHNYIGGGSYNFLHGRHNNIPTENSYQYIFGNMNSVLSADTDYGIIFGYYNKVSSLENSYDVALGHQNTIATNSAYSTYSGRNFLQGHMNYTSAHYNVLMGYQNSSDRSWAYIFGNRNSLSDTRGLEDSHSMIVGTNNIAIYRNSLIFGRYNTSVREDASYEVDDNYLDFNIIVGGNNYMKGKLTRSFIHGNDNNYFNNFSHNGWNGDGGKFNHIIGSENNLTLPMRYSKIFGHQNTVTTPNLNWQNIKHDYINVKGDQNFISGNFEGLNVFGTKNTVNTTFNSSSDTGSSNFIGGTENALWVSTGTGVENSDDNDTDGNFIWGYRNSIWNNSAVRSMHHNFVFGNSNTLKGSYSVAIGLSNTVDNADNSWAIGKNAKVSSNDKFVANFSTGYEFQGGRAVFYDGIKLNSNGSNFYLSMESGGSYTNPVECDAPVQGTIVFARKTHSGLNFEGKFCFCLQALSFLPLSLQWSCTNFKDDSLEYQKNLYGM